MDRRRYLSALAAVGVGGLAGCTSAGRPTADETDTATATTRTERAATGEQYGDLSLPVPEDELRRGAPKDRIPAITEPAFGEDWSGVSPILNGYERVIGVERDGRARAYPIAVLNFHEIVNDDFGGPLLVTYCPLCRSGVTATRVVDGGEARFGVSGHLWRSNLVMYDDRTGSLWSQLLATAIRGPETGETLTLVPSTMTTWKVWKRDHPDTEVLLPPPESGTVSGRVKRIYERDPYDGYDETRQIGVGPRRSVDDRLHPKAVVIGIESGGTVRAYPLDAVTREGAINDAVGDLPVVVAAGPDDTLVAFDRRVGGKTLEFEADGRGYVRAGGSRWRLPAGLAVNGPHEGVELDPATDSSPMFWFAWADFHPETGVYRSGAG